MTLIPRWWPRGATPPGMSTQQRVFQITSKTGLLTKCHWQPSSSNTPTILLIHGLEGCTESHYMIGLAHKVWARGWNCIRINQRNCGGSEHLTPTLYHNGLSQDYRQIIQEITEKDGCRHIWLIGYSMGGNLTLKLAGEMGEAAHFTARRRSGQPKHSASILRACAATSVELDLSSTFLTKPQSQITTQSSSLSWKMGPLSTSKDTEHVGIR